MFSGSVNYLPYQWYTLIDTELLQAGSPDEVKERVAGLARPKYFLAYDMKSLVRWFMKLTPGETFN